MGEGKGGVTQPFGLAAVVPSPRRPCLGGRGESPHLGRGQGPRKQQRESRQTGKFDALLDRMIRTNARSQSIESNISSNA
jgi:hypothetical protein